VGLPEDGGVAGKPVMEAGGHRQAHGPGSVEEKVVAADVAGVVAGEEEHGVGDVQGGEGAVGQERLLRHARLGLLQSEGHARGVLQHALEHGRGGGVRRHHVHADAVAAELQRRGPHQARERRLAHAVRVRAQPAHHARGAARAHDGAAPGRLHHARGVLDPHHGASQVHRQRLVELREVELLDGPQRAHEPGVAVVHVQLPLPPHGLVHHGRHLVLAADIAAHELRLLPELLRQPNSPFLVHVCDHDEGTVLHEQANRRLPYATRAARHHRHFACKPVMSFQATDFHPPSPSPKRKIHHGKKTKEARWCIGTCLPTMAPLWWNLNAIGATRTMRVASTSLRS
jgi:hypothetical protein